MQTEPPAGGPSGEPSAVELPLTPAMRACLRAKHRRARQVGVVRVGLAIIVGLLFVPRWLPAEWVTASWVALALVLGIPVLVVEWGFHTGLRRSTYFRATGPLRMSMESGVGWDVENDYYLHVGERRIPVARDAGNDLGRFATISDQPWGSAEYSQPAGLIFEVRGASGQVLYRAPGYTPEG